MIAGAGKGIHVTHAGKVLGQFKVGQRSYIAILKPTLLNYQRALVELRDSEKRYQRLFESSGDGILPTLPRDYRNRAGAVS